MIGQTISHYRIAQKLGEGGMGVVYLADDTSLGRRVALKLLPQDFAKDKERLARFEAEARLASSINHPHIVAIYELGEANGQPFIAMEYVEGRSLRALLKTQGLGCKKLLDLAVPAAEALGRAHRAGVIHRDIKPENLLVSDDGYIKVADFGLAKLKPGLTPDAAMTGAVTGAMTGGVTGEALTSKGSVMGTAPYMSPEQLGGAEADARSDIFALGAVLYEMAAGNSPFLRESTAKTSAAILRDTPPPLSSVARDLPPEFERIVSKALEKEPEYRYQSMEELASDLKRLRRDLESGRVSGAVPTQARPTAAAGNWKLIAGLGSVALLALTVAGYYALRGTVGTKTAPSYKVTQLTSLPGLEDSPTWSPDGRSLAYVSDAAGQLDIYVQQIAGGRAIRLTDSDADDAQPAWSPDGSSIAFVSARARPDKRFSTMLMMGQLQPFFAGRNGDVWVMPALGGAVRRIAEDAYYPAWSPDSKQLVYQAMRDGIWGLWISAADGSGMPRFLVGGQTPVEVFTQPAWSPDGKWIALCKARVGQRAQILVVASSPAAGAPLQVSVAGDFNVLMPSWSPDGKWLYFTSDRGGAMNLWRVRFSADGPGDFEPVTSGVEANLHARPDPTGQRVAYSSVRVSLDLWEYDIATRKAAQLTSETTQEDFGRPSPDGKWLSFFSNRGGSFGLWLQNRKDDSLTQVSSGSAAAGQSLWSRDSQRLYYYDTANRPQVMRYEVAAGTSTRVADAAGSTAFFGVSADERFVIISGPSTGIVRIEVSSGKRETLVTPPEGTTTLDPGCSPDGQWIAYYAMKGNFRSLWVVPLAGGTPRQITSGQGEDAHPSWSPDSKLIYFLRNHQDIYVVPLAGGEPRSITNYRSFSTLLDYPMITADGKKIVFTRNDKAGDLFLLDLPK